MAVPICTAGNLTPCCVLACYSVQQMDSVPLLIKFVQYALRYLCQGHEFVSTYASGTPLTRQVFASSDIDATVGIAMQSPLAEKKRPHNVISQLSTGENTLLSVQQHSPNYLNNLDPSLAMLCLEVNSQPSVHQNLFRPDVKLSRPLSGISPSAVRMSSFGMKQLEGINNQFTTDAQTIATKTYSNRIYPKVHGKLQIAHFDHSHGYQKMPSQDKTEEKPQPLKEDLTVIMANIETFNSLAKMNRVYNDPHFNVNEHGIQLRASTPSSKPLSLLPSLPTVPYGAAVSETTLPESYFQDASTSHSASSFRFDNDINVPRVNAQPLKTCRSPGCQECITMNTTHRPFYCLRHRNSTKYCKFLGCTKCAQGSTRFCISHGGGRRCTFAGCDKGARDKFFCAA